MPLSGNMGDGASADANDAEVSDAGDASDEDAERRDRPAGRPARL